MWPTLEDVEPLWMGDYHDGVLSGVASVAGRICWFRVAAETLEGQPSGSRYLIFEMTPEEADEVQRRHARAETFVGTHLCYHLPREDRRLQPRERWKEFYGDFTSPGWKPPRIPQPYLEREPIGEVTWNIRHP
jgi:hypothetical protein